MFGYVVPCKPELKIKQYSRYQAYYCGLCKCIGSNYGQKARLLLNYDSVFAALLLTSVNGENCDCKAGHTCIYKPFKKEFNIIEPNSSLITAADLNIIFAWNKYIDDRHDEHSFISVAVTELYKAEYLKAKKRQPEIAAYVEACCSKLRTYERSGEKEIDLPPDIFGHALEMCFKTLAPSSQKTVMGKLGYHLGRWIYLCDAWEDRERDKKHGNYNIFNIVDAKKDRTEFLLYNSLNLATEAFELLSLASDKEILDNIILEGCFNKTRAVLGGADE